MLISMPETVRQAWGELVAHDFTAWLEGTLEERTVNRAEWTQTMVRFGTIEHDVADLKVELRELRREMNDLRREMNERFDRMGAQFDERFDRLHEQMATQTRWSIGLLAVFGTLIAILVGIGQLAPLFLP